MPVTAKFSEEFYAKFGHRVVDGLVDWFNKVDVAYRSEFRELFEVHFARFDAKLEQRIAELRAELRSELHGEVAGLRAELSSKLAALETRLIRWMFLFWIGTIGTMIALLRF
jgi:hypothetical protein